MLHSLSGEGVGIGWSNGVKCRKHFSCPFKFEEVTTYNDPSAVVSPVIREETFTKKRDRSYFKSACKGKYI